MSLKLGNTNIAGTQVLYSTTGNNTDGAMTQNATTTQLNLKANDADVVHKTGDEIITGVKTFNSNLLYKQSTQDFTATPTQPLYTEIRNVDRNGFEIGQFRVWKDTDGANVIDLLGRYQNNSVSLYGATLGIKTYSDGRSFTYAPASDVANSIVTTISKSKTQNGHFKLGNGLIIQFGLVTNMSNNKAWVNFSIPFTTVPQVVTTSDKDGVNDGYNSYVSGTTTTGFNAFNKEYGTSVNCLVHWIAAGY